MEVLSRVDHVVVETILQQPGAYLATMPPHWANIRASRHVLQWGGVRHQRHLPILASRTLGKAPTPPSSNFLSLS